MSAEREGPADPWLAEGGLPGAGVAHPPPRPVLEVDKSERRMWLKSGGRMVREYVVALGFAPEGDKEREGDGKTPEGRFYLCYRNGRSRFHRFIGISYPAPEDAARGVRSGQITSRQQAATARAHRRRHQPPWNTALGGAVGLHGGGTGRDWTWGCVAVTDQEIEELYHALPLGTPVVIRP